MNSSPISTAPLPDETRLRRWRLVLGSEAESSCGKLSGVPAEMEQALAALIEADGKGGLNDRRGGRAGSAPSVARWLGDIRKYFPGTVVQGLAVRARQGARPVQAVTSAPGWDEELAALPLPLLRAMLGVAA